MKRVLIVDDADFMRKMLRDIFTENGIKVIGEATNGRDAIRLYNSLKPDFVTMDITMPDVDGIRAVKNIINFDTNAKIIVCSIMKQQNMILEAIRSGAKDFITKPIEAERLMASVNKLFENEKR